MQKICLIDDDKVLQFIFSTLVKKNQLAKDVLLFEDAHDALDFLEGMQNSPEKLPDLIFVDLHMPNVDGWEFVERYTLLGENLPKAAHIYIISSSIHPEDQKKAKSLSRISGYLLKPIDETELIRVIRSHQP